jgi:chromosome partitioning protein
MAIVTVGSTKGGVGKSTIACNLAVEASIAGVKTLLVDADIQGSSISFRSTRDNDDGQHRLIDIQAVSITTPTLHKDLKEFERVYGLILVDAGGRESAVFRSAMVACDMLLIPVLPSQYDIWAANDTIRLLHEARTYKDIPAYFVVNQVTNTNIAKEAIEAMQSFADNAETLQSTLFSRTAYKSSIVLGKGVSEYEPKGKAAQEMRALYREVMETERLR